MSLDDIPCVYLVTSMVRIASGQLQVEGRTVCSDRDLAFEMAATDTLVCDRVAIHALDANGRHLFAAPIYSSGAFSPLSDPAGLHGAPPSAAPPRGRNKPPRRRNAMSRRG